MLANFLSRCKTKRKMHAKYYILLIFAFFGRKMCPFSKKFVQSRMHLRVLMKSKKNNSVVAISTPDTLGDEIIQTCCVHKLIYFKKIFFYLRETFANQLYLKKKEEVKMVHKHTSTHTYWNTKTKNCSLSFFRWIC